MTTKRQKAAVKFTETELNIKFKGNIDDNTDVSKFLNLFLNKAKRAYDIREEECYEALGSIGDMFI